MRGPSLPSALGQGVRNVIRSLLPMAVSTFLVAIYLVTSRPVFFTDLVVFPVICWGLARLHLDAIDGPASWSTLLSVFDGRVVPRLLRMLGFLLLYLIVAAPIGLVLWAGGAALTLALLVSARAWVEPVDRLVWAMVQVSPVMATIPLARFLLTPFALVDLDASLGEALKVSWQRSQRRTLSLLALSSSTVLCAVALMAAWHAAAEIVEVAPVDRLLEAWTLTVTLHLGLAQLGMALAMVPVAALAVIYKASVSPE